MHTESSVSHGVVNFTCLSVIWKALYSFDRLLFKGAIPPAPNFEPFSVQEKGYDQLPNDLTLFLLTLISTITTLAFKKSEDV
jgi:hypothetical protein